ncbi:MAG: hypothetical protein V4714_10075 [Bacteroidota bacterium]
MMQFLTKKRWKSSGYVLVAAYVCLVSCKPDDSLQQQQSPQAFPLSQKANFELSYEVEHLSFETFPGSKAPKETQFLDDVRGTPLVDRQEVKLRVFTDGNSEYTIKHLEPTIQLPSKKDKEVLPDKTPRSVLTRIMGNTAYFYDKNDQLLAQQPISPDFLRNITQQLHQPNASLASIALMQKGALNVEDLAIQAQNEGAIVTRQPNNLVTIRYKNSNPSPIVTTPTPAARTDAGADFTTVNMYNSKGNILIGSRVYDDKQTLLLQAFCKYKKGKSKGSLDLDMLYMETFSVNSQGRNVKMISNVYFRNLQVIQQP